MTFTADENEIKIPLTNAQTEIYFDGVKVSGISGGGELVFDLADDKISIARRRTCRKRHSTSTEYVDTGDICFEVETDGAGTVTICGQKFTATDKNIYVVNGNSSGEIKVAPLAEEFKDDDSEAAGKTYRYDKAGNYIVNGITFHAEKGTKVQTITRGVEFDLSSGKFQYDGLTLDGKGTAQINRYNSKLITLTDGAKVSGDDESKYFNRQFEITGTVEIGGKKFETNQQIRCGLINVPDKNLNGFVVDDNYVQIQDDSYERVKVVDKEIATIEGVKASAQMSGNGFNLVNLFNASGELQKVGEALQDTALNLSEEKGD